VVQSFRRPMLWAASDTIYVLEHTAVTDHWGLPDGPAAMEPVAKPPRLNRRVRSCLPCAVSDRDPLHGQSDASCSLSWPMAGHVLMSTNACGLTAPWWHERSLPWGDQDVHASFTNPDDEPTWVIGTCGEARGVETREPG
jgi:hypothetical protein